MENKKLKVAVSKPPGSEKNCNLYVAGLEPHVTGDDLFTIFKVYGTVSETKILTADKTSGASRGVGFVRYENPQDAQNAIKALNGITLAGSSKPLTVRVAEKKDNKSLPMVPVNTRNMRFNPMGYYSQTPQFQYGGLSFTLLPLFSHFLSFSFSLFLNAN